MSYERKSQSRSEVIANTKTNRNALVHGVYASEIILPWESEQEFERLHEELQQEWNPSGPMELETVFGLARLFWVKRRLMRTWELGFRRDPVVQEMVNSGMKSWAEFRDRLRDQANEGFSAVAAAKDLYSQMQVILKSLTEELGKGMDKPEWHEVHKLHQQWQTSMGLIQKFFLLPAKTERPPAPTRILEQPYEPETLERIVRLEAALDARIDKTMARLVSLKEYKRLIGMKSVNLGAQPGSKPLQRKVVK